MDCPNDLEDRHKLCSAGYCDICKFEKWYKENEGQIHSGHLSPKEAMRSAYLGGLEDHQPHITTETRYAKLDTGKAKLDEVLLYVDGECKFHLEGMSDQAIWFVLYSSEDDEHFWVSSKNGKSHIRIEASQ